MRVHCRSKCLHSDHCPQGGSEPGLNGLESSYIPTSSFGIRFSVLEDSDLSVETCLDTGRHKFTPFETVTLFVVNNHLMNGVSFNLESCWSCSVLSVITAICLRSIQGVAHVQLWRNRFKRCELMPSHLDMERHTYPQPAAFLSQRTRITPCLDVLRPFSNSGRFAR